MLKIFRADLAVDVSKIVAVEISKFYKWVDDTDPVNWTVNVELDNGSRYHLEYFDTQENAETYLEKVVESIVAAES